MLSRVRGSASTSVRIIPRLLATVRCWSVCTTSAKRTLWPEPHTLIPQHNIPDAQRRPPSLVFRTFMWGPDHAASIAALTAPITIYCLNPSQLTFAGLVRSIRWGSGAHSGPSVAPSFVLFDCLACVAASALASTICFEIGGMAPAASAFLQMRAPFSNYVITRILFCSCVSHTVHLLPGQPNLDVGHRQRPRAWRLVSRQQRQVFHLRRDCSDQRQS